MKRVISILLCLVILGMGGVYLYFYPNFKQTYSPKKIILTLWHVDGFEGGKGSRAAFLNNVAKQFEKEEHGVYIMVKTLTAEGVTDGLSRGECPDLLSFSCGVEGAAEVCREIGEAGGVNRQFTGGMIGDKYYAAPWCAGSYYLFCLRDDFTDIKKEDVLLSVGGKNLPQVAAVMNGIEFAKESDSTSAYVQFLQGKAKYLLGTQRDICRFTARNVVVYQNKLTEYNDLYQYIGVCSDSTEIYEICQKYVKKLCSDGVQDTLDKIGMYSAKSVKANYTLSPFVSSSAIEEIKNANGNFLKSYLKPLN